MPVTQLHTHCSLSVETDLRVSGCDPHTPRTVRCGAPACRGPVLQHQTHFLAPGDPCHNRYQSWVIARGYVLYHVTRHVVCSTCHVAIATPW